MKLKRFMAKIALLSMLVNLLPFGIGGPYIANAVDVNGTAEVNLTLNSPSSLTEIIGDNFTINLSTKNEKTSEGPSYNLGYVVVLPDGISFVSSSLGTPTTVTTTGSTTTLIFKTSDYLLEGTTSDNETITVSGNTGVGNTKTVKVLSYAEDNIYGLGAVPSGAPPGTLSGGIDTSGGGADPAITFPDDIDINTDLSQFSFADVDLTNIPFRVSKNEAGEMLVGKTYTTTLKIEGNSVGDLKNFHLQDVIPKNRQFLGFTQTGSNIGGIDIIKNYPTSGEVTLDLTGITVPLGTDLDIKYQTRIVTHDISEYTGATILLNTGAITQEGDSSPNTLTQHTGGLAVNGGPYPISTWNDGTSDIDVNSSTITPPITKTPNAKFSLISKGVDKTGPVIGDVLTYTVDIDLAKNINFDNVGSGSYIEDTLPDGLVFSGTVSSTISSGSGTAFVFGTSSVDSNGDTTIRWELPSGEVEHDSTVTIVYQAVVDGNFEGSGTLHYESTKSLTNTVELNYTIADSNQNEEWGFTDPTFLGDFLSFSVTNVSAGSDVSAPNPTIDTRLISIKIPDGTTYDSTNYSTGIKVPVGSTLEFSVSMDFPNVEFLNARLINALPLLAGPNSDAYDISFQTNTGLLDVFGSGVLYNTNDKTSGSPASSFVNSSGSLTLTGTTPADTYWIDETPANNLEFNLGSGDGNKTFSILFKVDILPNVPASPPTDGLHPLKDASIGTFSNELGNVLATQFFDFKFDISLPYLTMSKVASGSSIEAGSNVDYTITIENSGQASAFVENVVDTLPDNMDFLTGSVTFSGGVSNLPNTSFTQSGNILSISFNTGAVSGTRSLVPINNTGTLTIDENVVLVNYTTKANSGFIIIPGDIRTNSVNFDYYASSGSTSNGVNNYGPLEDSATFTSAGPSLVRTIISSSEPDTSGDNMEIGEEFTTRTIITLPGGTYNSASFRDDLHNGYLLSITGSVLSASGSITFSNGTGNVNYPGNDLNFNFGTIVNADTDPNTVETIVIETTSRVKNTISAANNRKNEGEFYYNGNNIRQNVSVDIYEPNILLTKTVAPTTGDADDIVGYTITVTNNSSQVPAYDLEITDTLPSNITYVTGSLSPQSFSGTSSDLFTGSGLTLAKLDTSEVQSFTFSGVVSQSVAPNTTETNFVYLDYDSLDDDNSPNEKDYSTSSSAGFTITDLNLVHELYSTDLADTGSGQFNATYTDLAVGETAYFRTTIDVPESSFTGLVVTQNLPIGFKFLTGSINFDTIGSHTSSGITISPDNVIEYDFGDVVNVGTGITQVILLSEAVVLDNPANSAGTTKTSTLTADYGVNSKNANVNMDIVEPSLSIVKDYSPNTGDAGDSIATTITITNNGSSPAYDISWADFLPPKVTGSGFTSSGTFTKIDPGSNEVISYDTILGVGVTLGEVLTGTATVDYSSFSGSPAEGERSYTGSDTDTITIASPSGLQAILNSSSDAKIGDVSNYTIKVPVTEGTTNSLVVSTTIPAGMVVDPTSIILSQSGSISYTGVVNPVISPSSTGITTGQTQTIIWTFPTIVNSDTNNGNTEFITMNYEAVTLNSTDTNNGDTKTHNASANYNSSTAILNAATNPVTVREPNIVLNIAHAYTYGLDFNYLFTITNNGGATAYDLDLSTILESGLGYTGSIIITNSGGAVNLTNSGTDFSLDSLPINGGSPLTFTLSGVISDSIAVNTALTTTGTIIYTSQSGAYSQVVSNPLNSQRTSSGGVDDYTTTNNDTITVDRALLDEAISVVDLNGGDGVIGDVFEYTILLTNTGTQNLTNIDVTLNIDNSFTGFTVMSIPGGSVNNSTGSLNITGINIPIGATGAIVYRVIAKDTVIDGTTITSTGNVSNSAEGAIGGNPSVPVTIYAPIFTTSIIEIDDDAGILSNGELVTHSGTITNIGSATGNTVEVTLVFNTGSSYYQSGSLVFGTGTKANTGSVNINHSTNTLTFTITDIPPGGVEIFEYKTEATGGVGDSITTNLDVLSAENIGTGSISNTLLIGGGLSIDLVSSNTANVGNTASYKIQIPVGQGTTNDLDITSTIPEGMAIIPSSVVITQSGSVSYTGSATPSASPSSDTIVAGQTQSVTYDFGTVTNSDSDNQVAEFIIIEYDVTILNTSDNNLGDTKVHQASANYDNGGSVKNKSSQTLTITEPQVGIDINNSYVYGNELSYNFTITNTGTSTAYDLDISTFLDTGLSYSGNIVITNSGGAVNLSKVGNDFTIDSLPVNGGSPLIFTLTGVISDTVINDTVLSLTGDLVYTSVSGSLTSPTSNPLNTERSGGGGLNDHNDSDNDSVILNKPLLNETISVVDLNGGDSVIGDIFEYTITLTNSGHVDLTNINVTLDIPGSFTGFTVMSFSGSNNSTSTGGINNAGYLDISGISLLSGATKTIVYRVTAKEGVVDGTVVTSTGVVSDTPEKAIGGSPSVPVTIHAPIFTASIEEIDTSGILSSGEIVTHSGTITNIGSATGNTVDVTVAFSTGVVLYQTGTLTFGSGSEINTGSIVVNNTTNTITFTIFNIPPNTTETFEFETLAIGVAGDTITSTLDLISVENIGTGTISNTLTLGGGIVLDLVSSSSASIGDISSYKVSLPVGPGTTSLIHVDSLVPVGMAIVPGSVTITTDSSVSYSGTVTPTLSPDSDSITVGQTQTGSYDFTNVVNSDSNTSTVEYIFIEYDVVNLNSTDNNDTNTKAHTARANYNSSPYTKEVTSSGVTIVEPYVSVNVDHTYVYGKDILYNFTLENTATATAYDLDISTLFSTGLTYNGLIQITNSGGATSVAIAGDNLLISSLPINSGNPLTFSITGTVSDSIPNDTFMTLTGDLTYTSVSGNHTFSISNPLNTERSGAGGIDDYSDSDSDTFQLNKPLLDETISVVDTNTGIVTLGDTLEYTITITNPGHVDLTNIDVTLDIPSEFSDFNVISIATGAVNNSTQTGGANSVGYLDVSGIGLLAGETKTIVYEVVVRDNISDNTLVNSVANVSDTPEKALGGLPNVQVEVFPPVGRGGGSGSSSRGSSGGSGGSSSSSGPRYVPSKKIDLDIPDLESAPDISPEKAEKIKKLEKVVGMKKEKIADIYKNIQKDYDIYLELKKKLEAFEIKQDNVGESLIKLPAVLPKTGTPISSRTNTLKQAIVETDLPSDDIFRLAGSKNIELSHWLQVLPEADKYSPEYLVIPSNGLVIPVNNVPEDTTDFSRMVDGREIQVNKYLKTGVMQYPKTSANDYGQPGNKVIFGHSSYFTSDDGRYKTHFQKIIELDEGEEIWIYKLDSSGKYKRYIYKTYKSYNTKANDVSVLKPTSISNLTLFTCTPIGGIAGRWIIRAEFVSEEKRKLESVLYGEGINREYKKKITRVIFIFNKLSDGNKKIMILKVYNRIEDLESRTDNKDVIMTLNYMKLRFAREFFE